MNRPPLISVCMITYNHERYIAQAIEGVLMQKTNFPIELVIGEDCSTDNTRKICEAYAEKYPEIIKLLPSDRNLGMNPNFVRTFEACTGKYIALCEGDDYWIDPLKLKKQVNVLESKEEVSLVCHDFIIGSNNRNIEVNRGNYNEFKVIKHEDILKKNNIATCSVMLRGNTLESLDKMIKYPYGDHYLWINLLKYGDGLRMNEIMSYYRVHSGGVYSSVDLIQKKFDKLKFYQLLEEDGIISFRERTDLTKELVSSYIKSVSEMDKSSLKKYSNNLIFLYKYYKKSVNHEIKNMKFIIKIIIKFLT